MGFDCLQDADSAGEALERFQGYLGASSKPLLLEYAQDMESGVSPDGLFTRYSGTPK